MKNEGGDACLKQGLIYINYDSYDYVNYFHFMIDDEVVLKYIPIENIDAIFSKLDQMDMKDSDITWCIVADQNATDWEFEKEFSDRGRKINSGKTIDLYCISELLKNEFNMEYSFDHDADADQYLRLCFPEQEKADRLLIDKEDIIDKTKEIFDRAEHDDEITEFARIILEKYERMCGHE